MILIIGLGNPGSEFVRTRHNVGRDLIETIRKHYKLPEFGFDKKYNAELCQGKIEKEKLILARPNTFMNKSGTAVGALAKFFKIKPADIYIVHDDTDLEFGRTKLSFGKRSAGHKGVESVIKVLKTLDFWRLRVGIGDKKDSPAEKMVLKKFTPKDDPTLKKIRKKTLEAVDLIGEKGPEAAMNFYNS